MHVQANGNRTNGFTVGACGQALPSAVHSRPPVVMTALLSTTIGGNPLAYSTTRTRSGSNSWTKTAPISGDALPTMPRMSRYMTIFRSVTTRIPPTPRCRK